MRATLATALIFIIGGCSHKKIPENWAKLGVPTQGLALVRDETNQDRFSADYRDSTADDLLGRVESGLVAAGYQRRCSQFEGRVRGYARADEQLLVKVDSFGPVQALSLGNRRGSDKLLFGVCFDGYRLGPAEPVK
jgi:hypothetical protein